MRRRDYRPRLLTSAIAQAPSCQQHRYNLGLSARWSLWPNIRPPDHLAPLFGFLRNEPAERSRRAGKQLAADLGEPPLDLHIANPCIDFPVHLVAPPLPLTLCLNATRPVH